jgi:hypothetical protein
MFGAGPVRRQVTDGFEMNGWNHATCTALMIFSRQIAAEMALDRHFSASRIGTALAPTRWQGQQKE